MRNTIEADEEMLYSDKEIHFDESLTIEGRAVFETARSTAVKTATEAVWKSKRTESLNSSTAKSSSAALGCPKGKLRVLFHHQR